RVMQRFGNATMPRETAWILIREIGAALAHAHARGVVHADLKPQNVMICRDGSVKLLDFGASSGVKSEGQTRAVTPAYASCDLLEGHAAEWSDDLFALGCLAYELLAGNHPFGYKRSVDSRAAGLTPARPANLSNTQWQTLKTSLAFERAERALSVNEWLE